MFRNMKKVIGVVVMLVLISCGTKSGEKTNVPKPNTDSIAATKPNKDYLKKRPEEFREFFLLSNVVPFTGKVATKKDVNSGLAIFNLNAKADTSHKPLFIRLPFYAFLKQKNNAQPKFVAIMQAESLKNDTILGYKEANGMFGICKPRELEYFERGSGNVYSTISK